MTKKRKPLPQQGGSYERSKGGQPVKAPAKPATTEKPEKE